MVIKLVELLEHIKNPKNIKVCAHPHPEEQMHKMPNNRSESYETRGNCHRDPREGGSFTK